MISCPAMRRRLYLAAAVFASIAAMALARAWITDDAFITFRVVEQLLAGHGPVYNAGERVQVFTHPLWMLVLAAWAGLGASLFPGAAILSLAIFAAGLAALFVAFRDKPLALVAAGLAMLLCRAVVDFATSGLETPLTFALACAAAWALRSGRAPLALAALAAMPLNRLDLLPWVLPLAWVAGRRSRGGPFAALAIVAAPAAAWLAFSTLYYGSPWPNTAFAKLGAGLGTRLDGGAAYVVASLMTDPGAVAIVAGASWMALRAWRHVASIAGADRELACAASIAMALALAYAFWCGGDFMLGRFLLPALWAGAILLLAAAPEESGTTQDPALKQAATVLAVLGGAHLLLGHGTFPPRFEGLPRGTDPVAYAGAIDERAFYVRELGLFSRAPAPARDAVGAAADPPRIFSQLGVPGYAVARAARVEDDVGLVDPLVARIEPLPNPRPGHAWRPAPAQFWRWPDPAHRFADPLVDALAARLRKAHIETPLLTTERFGAIAALLRDPGLPSDDVRVQRHGDEVEIRIRPPRLALDDPATERYAVVPRLYDHRVRTADRGPYPDVSRYPGLDAGCAPMSRPGAIPVEPRAELVMRCPTARIAEDGLLLRVGAIGPGQSLATARWGIPVVAVRPAGWWLEQLPTWWRDGWKDPVAVLLGAFLSLGAAVAMLRRSV